MKARPEWALNRTLVDRKGQRREDFLVMGHHSHPPRSFRLADNVLDLPVASVIDVERWQAAFSTWDICFSADGILTVRDFQRRYATWCSDARHLAWSVMRLKPLIVDVEE